MLIGGCIMTQGVEGNSSVKASYSYEGISESRAWRHTIGRVSSLARLPIYMTGLAFQTAKVTVKAVLSPIAEVLIYVTGTKKLDSWRFTGVAKDGLAWVRISDKIGSALLGVLFAPPKPYFSFYEGVKEAVEITLLGAYHNLDDTAFGTALESAASKVFTFRPQYSKSIVQSNGYIGLDCCCPYLKLATEQLSPERADKVKAG